MGNGRIGVQLINGNIQPIMEFQNLTSQDMSMMLANLGIVRMSLEIMLAKAVNFKPNVQFNPSNPPADLPDRKTTNKKTRQKFK
jgi:hypothetical protein